ncbi:hypothetical protein BHE74_00033205 [Ensete ventricosum]|nr:hypothetical protein GW17_00038564 [Ensete ventricosum]RWW59833.1 hypothetical protein BHE74_00033205 [Ensete ventricosum]
MQTVGRARTLQQLLRSKIAAGIREAAAACEARQWVRGHGDTRPRPPPRDTSIGEDKGAGHENQVPQPSSAGDLRAARGRRRRSGQALATNATGQRRTLLSRGGYRLLVVVMPARNPRGLRTRTLVAGKLAGSGR